MMNNADYKTVKVSEEQFIKIEKLRLELREKTGKSVSKGKLIQQLIEAYERQNN